MTNKVLKRALHHAFRSAVFEAIMKWPNKSKDWKEAERETIQTWLCRAEKEIGRKK